MTLIANGTLIVHLDGASVGQINGLAVLDVGGYAFGRPARVTVSVGVGQAGLINIEREARLSGSTHDKGLMILAGFLRWRDAPMHLRRHAGRLPSVRSDATVKASAHILANQVADVVAYLLSLKGRP